MDVIADLVAAAGNETAMLAEAAVVVTTLFSAFSMIASNTTFPNTVWPESAAVEDGDHFDFIISGGGTAGLVLLNRLSEITDWNILVVEAGGDPSTLSQIPGLFFSLTHTVEDWDFYAEYDENTSHSLVNERVSLTRGKVLGGSSSIDHLLYERASPSDLNSWGDFGMKGWNYDNCLPYYKKLEKLDYTEILTGPTSQYHCTNGIVGACTHNLFEGFDNYTDSVLTAFEEIGFSKLIDLNGPNTHGSGQFQFRINSDEKTRASTAQNYLLPIVERSNIKVLKNAIVSKVIIEDNTATGVEIITETGDSIQVHADKEVIMSAGVYGTPKILKLSGIGPQDELESHGIEVIADLPVGENLQDHAFVPMAITSAPSTPVNFADIAVDVNTFPVPIVGGSYSFSGNSRDTDFQHISLTLGSSSPYLFYLLYVNFNYNVETALSYILDSLENEIIFSLVVLTNPDSKGQVKLRSTDPTDSPMVYNNFLAEESDIVRMIESVKKMFTLKDTSYFSNFNSTTSIPPLPKCKEFENDKNSDEFWRCYVKSLVSTTYHPVGTTKMAPKQKGGVVDNRLRVYDVANLRVVDDSIMPNVPSAKTTTTTIMIAEKAADMIKREYRQKVERFRCTSTNEL